MTREFDYDVFVSYVREDEAAVHPLAERLRDDGLEVWLDAWKIGLGKSIVSEIEEGLEKSRMLLMFMSKAYFESKWTSLERHTVTFRSQNDDDTGFIPILLEDCDPPAAIAHFSHLDWREPNEEAYQKLLTSCRQPETPAPQPIENEANGEETKAAEHPVPITLETETETANGFLASPSLRTVDARFRTRWTVPSSFGILRSSA